MFERMLIVDFKAAIVVGAVTNSVAQSTDEYAIGRSN
jgi:hypothetical protein